MEAGSIRANGIRFQYLAKGSGPLLLCLHGFPDHAHSFVHQLDCFAAQYRRRLPVSGVRPLGVHHGRHDRRQRRQPHSLNDGPHRSS